MGSIMPYTLSPALAAHYASLFYGMRQTTTLQHWAETLPGLIARAFCADRHGDWPAWQTILERLPVLAPAQSHLDSGRVGVSGQACDQAGLQSLLMGLHPWRKGPYHIHGIHIDTEWRSDWKWQRLVPHIQSLQQRLVLDVGCGNGFHLWCMLGAGARRVIGIDPTLLHVVQFMAIKHFMGEWPAHVLPLAVEDMPAGLRAFDTVFSMGVLYHRRSPIDHLLELKGLLRPGGELVLETLVVHGEPGYALLPVDRYARMRNVWFIPTCPTLEMWLSRCGFRQVRCVDITPTTLREQRSTPWMRFESLNDCLNPDDPRRTVENLPAPVRAIFIAQSPREGSK